MIKIKSSFHRKKKRKKRKLQEDTLEKNFKRMDLETYDTFSSNVLLQATTACAAQQ